MLAAVLLGIAQMERESILERQAAGNAAAKERGVYVGRQAGSTKGKSARAVELRQRGLSVDEIASAMDGTRYLTEVLQPIS